MLRSMLLAVALLGLSACAPTLSEGPAPIPPVVSDNTSSAVDQAAEAIERADAAIDRGWTAYVTIKRFSDMLVPYISPARAANLRAIQGLIEGAFVKARASADLAVKAAELARAAKAAGQLEELTTDTD